MPGRGENSRYESQLRPTPAGNVVYAVWGEQDASTGADRAMFAKAIAMRNEPPVASSSRPNSVCSLNRPSTAMPSEQEFNIFLSKQVLGEILFG